jgi:hypothetical protein
MRSGSVKRIDMSQSHWDLLGKVAATVWPLITLILGILIGSYVANRNQRKHWLLDNKRGEYRKLVTTLTDCGSKLIVFYGPTHAIVGGKEERRVHEASRNAANVLYNRLFIARELEILSIFPRWQNAVSALQKSRDGKVFTLELDGILNDIRTVAVKDFRDL